MEGIRIRRSNKVIQFNDSSGTDSLTLKDSDGFTIFKVDSQGTVKTRRGIQRL